MHHGRWHSKSSSATTFYLTELIETPDHSRRQQMMAMKNPIHWSCGRWQLAVVSNDNARHQKCTLMTYLKVRRIYWISNYSPKFRCKVAELFAIIQLQILQAGYVEGILKPIYFSEWCLYNMMLYYSYSNFLLKFKLEMYQKRWHSSSVHGSDDVSMLCRRWPVLTWWRVSD